MKWIEGSDDIAKSFLCLDNVVQGNNGSVTVLLGNPVSQMC